MAPPRNPSPPPYPAQDVLAADALKAAISDGRDLAKATDEKAESLAGFGSPQRRTRSAFSGRFQEAAREVNAFKSQSSWCGRWAENQDEAYGFASLTSRAQTEWSCDSGSWQQTSWKTQEACYEQHLYGRAASPSERWRSSSHFGSWRGSNDDALCQKSGKGSKTEAVQHEDQDLTLDQDEEELIGHRKVYLQESPEPLLELSEPEHEQTPEHGARPRASLLDGPTLLAKAIQGVRAQATNKDDPALLPMPGHKWLVSEPGHLAHELGSVVTLGEGSLVFGDRGILASEEYGAVPVQLVRTEDIPLYVEEKMKHMVSFEQRWIEHPARHSKIADSEA